MNNLRKSMVMLFIGVFVVSMLMIPFTPIANVASPVSQAPDQDRDFIQQWADRVENDMVGEKMDPMLISYMETGVMDSSIRVMANGAMKLLLYLAPDFDSNLLYSLTNVNWQMDLVVSRVASVSVDSIAALKQLEATDGIKYVQADCFIDRTVVNEPVTGTDMFHIDDVVGATSVKEDFGYDGTGAIVAIDDSGADFSHPDLIGAEYVNGGYPMSYDPSGVGLTQMYIANGSYVENTTAWLEAGNLLTYNGTDGNMYLDVTGWDPICNYAGGRYGLPAHLALIGDMIGIFEGAWGIDNATEYVMSELWKDWQIPDPMGIQNYTFGWAFQQRTDGVAWIFAPSMVYGGNLVIDWNGTYAYTNWWMDTIWNEVADMTDSADRAYYADLMDWSFTDDIAAGYVFNNSNNVLAADLDDDGTNDIGIGSLSWAYDDIGYLAPADYGVFFGITSDGMAWNALFNHDINHGMWTATAVAGRGVLEYEVYDNATTVTITVGGYTETTTTHSYYKLPGVANGSKIMACKGISSSGGLMADFWGAGFHLNTSAGPYLNESWWQYTTFGATHKADIVSNSWGWGPSGSWLQLYYYALVYDIASVPNVLKQGYPGTLFVFSAGNNGADYGKSGTPSGSYSVVSVGASITSHYYEELYGPEQTDGQVIYFSSNGPGFTGIVKPDILAPGYRGVSPQPFHDIWLGVADPYYWWQGTSLSCPVAAGVGAIIIEAYMAAHSGAKPTPQMLKNILLSSATDVGYDPFVQGHGEVNAYAAVNAVKNNSTSQYYFEASDSFDNYGAQVVDAWAKYMSPATAGGFTGMEYPTSTPVGLESSSIFFGSVEPSDVVYAALDVYGYDAVPIDGASITSVTPWEYTAAETFSFVLETSHYNDTNFIPKIERPTSFNLFDEITTAGYWTEFNGAQYVTINAAFPAKDIPIYARLFDWDDTIDTGNLNYWNFVTKTGDIVDHVSRYTDDCNLLTIRLADPLTMDHLFNYVPALQLDDAHAPTNVTITITTWARTPVTGVIGVTNTATGVNVSLTVPSDAEYGIHQGSITIDAGGWTHEVPYSYMVDFTMASVYGDNQTLVDGAGTLTPYETGAVTTSFIEGTTRYDEAGGVKNFRLNIPYAIGLNASVMVIRAEWMNKGTVVDFYCRNSENSIQFTTDDGAPLVLDPTPTSDLVNTIIWDPGHLINGSYWFWYTVNKFDGANVPENITITFQLYNATTFADASYASLWKSNDMTTPTSFSADAVLSGDHVVISNNWTVPAVPGLPEYHITDTKIALLSGLYETMTGTYPETTIDAWPIALTLTDDYAWETVEGITAGDDVRIVLDAQGGADPSFDVWDWNDANSNGLVDLDELGSTSLLSVDNGGGGTPESGHYTAAVSGDIAIRVFCWGYSWDDQGYKLTVDTRASVDILNGVNPEYAQFDTYELRRNITMTVQYTCNTATDVMFFDELGTVTFNNFFAPHVTVNTPVSLGSNRWNLTWSSTDLNAGDVPYYSIWLSRDAGVTYVLLQQNVTATNFTWDSSSWLVSNYIVRVRAYSCDFTNWTTLGYTDGILCDVSNPPAGYWPGDFTDAFSGSFAAGAVPATTPTPTTTTPPPTTSTPPPTTTTTTPEGVVIDPLLIGLLGGIGVGVVVLLILFLVRKK